MEVSAGEKQIPCVVKNGTRKNGSYNTENTEAVIFCI